MSATSLVLMLALLPLFACSGGCVTAMIAMNRLSHHGAGYDPVGGVDFEERPQLSDEDLGDATWALREFRTNDLSLAGTAITDRGFKHLVRIRSLEALSLSGTSVTPEGLAGFLKGAPPSLRSVIVPNHWDKDPELRQKLEAMMARHPQIEFMLGYPYGRSWFWRDIGEPEQRYPGAESQPAAACGGV